MITVLFYVSLFLVIVMLTVRHFGFYFINNKVCSNLIHKSDKSCHNIICIIRYFLPKIKFKNFHKLVVTIINFTKSEIILFKRKFDSQQPKFFLKPQKKNLNKGSVSFFLRNVSEYRDSLRNKNLLE